jgi:hypothetical protein
MNTMTASDTTPTTTRAVDATLVTEIKRLLREVPDHKVAVPLARCTRIWVKRLDASTFLSVDRFPGGGYRFRIAEGRGDYRRVEETYTRQADHDAEVAAEAQIDADFEAVFGR